MSAREKQAKINLLNIETEQYSDFYNPFQLETILKDCQNSHLPKDNQIKIKKVSSKSLSRKDIQSENNFKLAPSNRESLKKLLKKLQEMPSPEKKTEKVKKIKTLQAVSTTEPLLQIKQCFRVSSAKKEESAPKNINTLMNQDERIRHLIKKKMMIKRENEENKKTEKLTNFLRENHKIKPFSKRNSFYRKGSESKKLINLLF